MESLILGTAGHIDHGKTVLVKALTGINADRLAEEKKRGISIDLGFAHFKLPSGRLVGVVDVPGHERFVKNMLAGATGIDIVLLVVAADDGVMPQTREHLAIVDLLKVKKGVVVITKSDLADEEWLSLVEEDVKSLLKGTFLETAPVVSVSAKTGMGIKELIAEVDKVAGQVAYEEEEAPFRLPIDRVFILPGAGTIVTGTLWSGRIRREEKVDIQPAGLTARVRSIQIHNKKTDEALAGQRVALNLASVSKNELSRGDVVLKLGYLSPTTQFDGSLLLLKDAPKVLKNRARVRVHHGTSEVMGRVVLLSAEALKPGQSDFVQMRLEKPVVLKSQDRFIIRSYSPIQTIGGGEVLDVHPHRHKRFDKAVLSKLAKLSERDPLQLVSLILEEERRPFSVSELTIQTELPPSQVEKVLEDLKRKGRVELVGAEGKNYYVLVSFLREDEQKLLAFLEQQRQASSLSRGTNKQVIRTKIFKDIKEEVFEGLLGYLAGQGKVVVKGGLVSPPGAEAGLEKVGKELTSKVISLLKKGLFTPPDVEELAKELSLSSVEIKELIKMLLEKGEIVRVSSQFYFHPSVIMEAEKRIKNYFRETEKLAVSDFRQLISSSRKYALPLLNYFDSIGLTKREKDYRVLKKQ